jgi:xanthine dehydrogenase molybdenum-binding subunit
MIMAEYRYIGKVIPRKDSADIVSGRGKYLDDIAFPGLLRGKVLRSPHAHAKIRMIDKTKAEALPGVKAVLTWEDIPAWRGGRPPIFPLLPCLTQSLRTWRQQTGLYGSKAILKSVSDGVR